MRTVLIYAAAGLGWLVLTVLTLWGSFVVHFPTRMGADAVEDAVNHLANDALPGTLHIDSVDRLELSKAWVSGFKAIDLDDVTVIEVSKGIVAFDWSALLFESTIRLRDLQGYDGSVVLRDGRHSKVSISDVFSSEDSDNPTPNKYDLDLGWIYAEDVTLDVRMSDRPLVFGVNRASVEVKRFGQDPVQINLRRVAASMHKPSFLGIDISLRNIGGRIRPKTQEVMRIGGGACVGDHGVQVRVIYKPGPPKVARIIIDYEDGVGFLASLGMRIGDLLSGPLEVDERELPGSPPSCDGDGSGGGDGDSEDDGGSNESDEDDAGSDESDEAGATEGEESGADVPTQQELEDFDEANSEALEDADEQLEEALEAAAEEGQ